MPDNDNLNEMTANWARFSEYVYGEAPDFSRILLPKENAKLLDYDVFSVIKNLIVDYLNLGKNVWHGKATASIEGTLAFVNKYGLLQFSEDISYFEYAAELMAKSKKLYALFYNINIVNCPPCQDTNFKIEVTHMPKGV